MSPEHQERLKKATKMGVVLALGNLSVRNIPQGERLFHISYWEPSKTVLMDIRKTWEDKFFRVAGTVIHGPRGRADVADVQLEGSYDYSDDQVEVVEEAVSMALEFEDNSLQQTET